MKDRKCLFIHNYISLATDSARSDKEDEEKAADALIFCAAMFSVVSWVLQFIMYSFSTSVTGVCKNIPETLADIFHTLYIFILFSDMETGEKSSLSWYESLNYCLEFLCS